MLGRHGSTWLLWVQRRVTASQVPQLKYEYRLLALSSTRQCLTWLVEGLKQASDV